MSISFRSTGLAASILALSAAAFHAAPAAAQAAPQLLPYTVTSIAGGGTVSIAKGATCPVSGYTSTDAYGDGCLATEVQLGVPRFVTTDATGVVYFSDTNNGLIRRIDPLTGIISAVVGGAAASPASGTACGVGTSTDAHGDGCPASLVKIGKPEGLVFAANGDLYFADNSFDDVRKVAAVNGAITSDSIITNVAGNISTFGYNVNNTSTSGPVNAATQSYLNFPYGLALDAAGNLYIADEGNQAIEVVNTGTSTRTIQGMSVPAGTIAKIVGYGDLAAKKQGTDCPDFVSTTARGGCYFGTWVDGTAATASPTDNPFDVAVDAAGNVYFPNQFNYNVGKITAANILSNYAGIQGTKGTALKRATAGTFGIANTFDVALDSAANLYVSDGGNGVVWRVDAGTLSMYPIVGGATTTCSAAVDAAGDGCPGTQTIFPKSSGSGATLLPGTGGLFVDPFGSLYITDTTDNTIRVASSGTQFGAVGANQPTQIADIHFAAGDSPAANAYTITAGAANFTVGSATCTANSDSTTDCLLPITATPTTLGAFTGTLTVKSTLGKTVAFPLNGNYVNSPLTRTALAFTTGATCSGNTGSTVTVGTNTPVTLSATIFSTGSPTGSVTFFANGTQIGTPQAVKNGVATLTYTFATTGTYALTASYGGDTYFKVSTGKAGNTIVSANPSYTFAASPNFTPQSTVTAGQTALYSFAVSQAAFTGTITFACSGLPSGAACVFNPPSITNSGCTETDTVALSITTTQATPVKQTTLSLPLRGNWQMLGLVPGIALAFAVGLRRRRSSARLGAMFMAIAMLLVSTGLVACGKNSATPGTPAGTSTVTITATGSTGGTQTLTVPLTVK